MRLFSILLFTACVPHRMPDAEFRKGPRFHEDVSLSDGVALYTRVTLPKGEGPWPVMFLRAPYPMGPVLNGRCARFNRYGYACVTQDTRGRGRSEGEWLPFENEVKDGYESLAWIVEQDWCDGNIGMMGESYLGGATWAVAHDPPPELKTIVPIVIGTEMYDVTYEGGLFRHDILTAWMSLMPSDHTFRYARGSKHYHRALRTRPRRLMDEASWKEPIPWFQDWIAAWDPEDPYWNRPIVQMARNTPNVTPLPVLTMAGWSDAFVGPQLDTWERLGTKDRSHLVIGPWNHLTQVAAVVGQEGLSDEVGLSRGYQQWPRLLDWLGHHLKGEPLQYPASGVSSYVVNGGGWVHRDSWPPPTEPRLFRPAPGGEPQQCTGQLSTDGGPGEVQFTYDPLDPTPARGGAGVLAGSFPLWKGAEPGFIHQGRLCEKRDDLVGFVSGPLEEDLHIAGRIEAQVAFASDAGDTAVNVRVLELRPDGKRIHVREGIKALSHRDGRGYAVYQPGEVVEVALETFPVEYVFEAGSRVMVQFASASFPKYEAHTNVPGPWAEVDLTALARQRVIFEGTQITLPAVLPERAEEPVEN